jgi:hypothetical protein
MCPDFMSSNAVDQLLTTGEAARFLRLSAATLERLRVKGAGPLFIKLGEGKRCKVVYRLDDLHSFLHAHRRGSTGQEGGER